METVKILYANTKHIDSFHQALDRVAQEKIYIEMVEAPPIEKVKKFQEGLLLLNGPVFYALDGEKVVGWCDVFPENNPRQCHRGSLGMGLLPDYRGNGLGSQLLDKVIEHSRSFGLEKIELHVYTNNLPAVALYRKFGFIEEGLIKNYRKFDGEYFDCYAMAKFL